MKKVAVFTALLLLSGCAYKAQLMSRDDGRMYQGSINSDGFGSGSMSVPFGDRVCSGPFGKASSNDGFGFAQTIGTHGPSTSFFQNIGSAQYKALLSCTDNTGLRCDVAGDSSSGGGVCVDSKNRVYDLLYKH